MVSMLIDLASSIEKEHYRPEMIIGVLKGGIIPARIMSDLLDIEEMGIIGVRFYKGVSLREAKPELTIPPTPNVRGKNVLVVDDVIETGRTLQLVIDELYRYGVREVKTLSLYVKKWSPILPDYYHSVTDKWIVFPWEIRETLKNNIGLDNIISREDYKLYKDIVEKILKK